MANSLLYKILFTPFRAVYIFITFWGISFAFLIWNKLLHRGPSSLGIYYQKLFSSLGGTFIKAGQALAMRQDVLPIEQCEALSTLLDEVRPFDSKKGIKIIVGQLKKDLKNVRMAPNLVKGSKFLDTNEHEAEQEGYLIQFNQAPSYLTNNAEDNPGYPGFIFVFPEPVAAASFSQVYKAIDFEGDSLAIKVKRPHIEAIVFADTFLFKFTQNIVSFFGLGDRIGLESLIDEVVGVLKNELDYKREAKFVHLSWLNAEKIPNYVVPKLYKQYSGGKILTMEFLDGISVRRLMSLIRQKKYDEIQYFRDHYLNIPILCADIFEIVMRSVFEVGFFHADPHPGNIIILKNGKIGFIDFGIIGLLDEEMRQKNLEYLYYASRGETGKAASLFTEFIKPRPNADYEGIRRDMSVQIMMYLSATNDPNSNFAEKSSAGLFVEGIRLTRKYHFMFKQNIFLYYKALILMDHILIELDPSFDSARATRNFILEYSERMIHKRMAEEHSRENILSMTNLTLQLPKLIRSGFSYFDSINADLPLKGDEVKITVVDFVRIVRIFLSFSALIIAGVAIYSYLFPPEIISFRVLSIAFGSTFIASLLARWMERAII